MSRVTLGCVRALRGRLTFYPLARMLLSVLSEFRDLRLSTLLARADGQRMHFPDANSSVAFGRALLLLLLAAGEPR